jgi:lambda family phage portal protein
MNEPKRSTMGALLNPVDRVVAWLDPDRGLNRLAKRQALQAYSKLYSRAHEASTPSRLRKFYRDSLGPNAIVQQSALAIRAQTRHMVRNNDVARGIVRTMVNNVVGANGIGIEPQPRRVDGTIHETYAADLRKLHREWARRPEVQRKFTLSTSQRMLAWGWMRDGEIFSQDLVGPVPGLAHSTDLPYSFEMFESDLVPMEFNQGDIRQGIQRNAWGEAKAYWVYKGHPLEAATFGTALADLKSIDAARVRHLAFRDHIGQARGISEFASIIARLEDIKDYEESERIAAKVAAMLTAYVKKNAGDSGYDANDPSVKKDPDGTPTGRNLSLSPGMIIDGLAVGEEIGMIDSKRPNPNVVTFRQGQLRAVAAGIGASYSSISKTYDGTFSAQRQELVEQWVNYAILADEFVGQWLQPTWETVVMVAHMSGKLRIPRDVMPGTHDDALFIAQAMPWIDPYKEAMAWVTLARAGFASEIEIMRKRGVNPRDLLEQVTQWRKEAGDKSLVFTSDARNGATIAAPTAAATPLDDGSGAGATAAD